MKNSGVVIFLLGAIICAWVGYEARPKGSRTQPPILVSGWISSATVKKVLDLPSPPQSITIENSLGGSVEAAFKLADYINNHNLNIHFSGYCLSACAEIIIPSSARRTFSKNTLIGYHHNSVILNYLHKVYDPLQREFCYSDSAEKLRRIQREAGLNTEFWQVQYAALRVSSVNIQENGERCGELVFKTKYKFWFPSSQILSEELGLSFTKPICSDDQSCALKQTRAFLARGTRILVGELEIDL